jgi:hypothetical protein
MVDVDDVSIVTDVSASCIDDASEITGSDGVGAEE